jgi:FHS family L-fucose permease-like MFS transporter
MGANAAERTIEKANPALFIAMGIFAVVFVVLFIMHIPEPRLVTKEKVKHESSPFAFSHFVFGAIAIFMYVGIEIGIPHFANLFMTSDAAHNGLSIDPTIAGTVTGTYWFLMMIGRIVGAAIGGKISSKVMLSVASTVGIIFVILAIFLPATTTVSMPVFQSDISFGLAEVPMGVMFLVLCGLCTSVMWGGIFNLAVEGLGKYTEAASGIFMVMVCGGGILPLFQGFIADVSASYIISYWVVFGALAYMLFYAFIGSKVHKRAEDVAFGS